MTPEELARYNEPHSYEDIGSNIHGTFWWCSKCGTVEHNDNEFGPIYRPSNGLGCRLSKGDSK